MGDLSHALLRPIHTGGSKPFILAEPYRSIVESLIGEAKKLRKEGKIEEDHFFPTTNVLKAFHEECDRREVPRRYREACNLRKAIVTHLPQLARVLWPSEMTSSTDP